MRNSQTTAFELISYLFSRYGDDKYGENISQKEHMLQCAALAEKEGFDEEVILAALLHDIGHLCANDLKHSEKDPFGARYHEKIGSSLLKRLGFSDKVVLLVDGHVEAKRYLTGKFPHYMDKLSAASRETLKKQGGPMAPDECEVFEKDDHFYFHLKIREWDDLGKLDQVSSKTLEDYRNLILKHLQVTQENRS